jgi:hypothetical protein
MLYSYVYGNSVSYFKYVYDVPTSAQVVRTN